jgi:sugar phosphate isomerase/epimerase
VRLGVCETVIRTGLETDVVAAAAAGYAGLGVDVGRARDAGVDRAARFLREGGVVASSLLGTRLTAGRSSEDEVRSVLEVATELGAPSILVSVGPREGRSVADADREAARWFEAMAPLGVDHGARIALEPMHPILRSMTYVHTLRHAAALTGGRPGTGLVVDLAHLWWDADLVDDVAAHVGEIVTVQVSGVPTESLREMRYERCAPWEGDVPVAELLAAFAAAGYDGWVEDEAFARVPKEERAAHLARTRAFLADAL